MKKQLLLCAVIFWTMTMYSQFKVVGPGDRVLKDGHKEVFTSTCEDTEPCYWKVKVKNTSTEDLALRVYCEKLLNTDGTDMQMCIPPPGGCYTLIEEDTWYPSKDKGETKLKLDLKKNAEIELSFWNVQEGDPREWKFKVQEVNADIELIKEPFSFSYAYDPNATSIDDIAFKDLEVSFIPNSDQLRVTTQEPLALTILDLMGRAVQKVDVNEVQLINVSNLASQAYVLRFVNGKGQSVVKKMILK